MRIRPIPSTFEPPVTPTTIWAESHQRRSTDGACHRAKASKRHGEVRLRKSRCASAPFECGGHRARLTCLDRAELGRAAWKVLHTTFARFPEKPTDDEKEALRSYIYLFQRLYPWYVAPCDAAAEVRRKLTGSVAESALNTLERSLPNIHLRYLHEQRLVFGGASCTTK
jgi:hypothetical protein